ncbi:amidase [Sporobolomyces koalae]|uniref:amidase n=1 Tax=Sporobolomyces koalae TaxID=500713 RepID=UPI00316CBCA7
MTSLRVACLQLDPTFKNPTQSIRRADELLEGVQPGTLDFLVLPEMAFTGYCFETREDIAPFIEEVPAGKSTKWAMKTARRLGCYVQVGVPTLAPLNDLPVSSFDAPTVQDLYYNSVVLVNPFGRVETVYHKHFLYDTDKPWATAGTSFVSLDLPFPRSSPHHDSSEGAARRTFKYAPAICMDLNAEAFDESLEKLEFSNFVKRKQVDLVIASNAWLDSETVKPSDDGAEAEQVREAIQAQDSWDEVRGLVGYWVYRMSTNLEEPGVAFVVCNRIGQEKDSTFAGSSCVVELGDRPTVISHASKRTEQVIVAQVRLPSRD